MEIFIQGYEERLSYPFGIEVEGQKGMVRPWKGPRIFP
jgi:hypothetical protein